MSETVRMWTEIVFDVFYLATIWTLVGVMSYKLSGLSRSMFRLAQVFRAAFFFLVLGDTGLLGSRIIAYAAGGLEYSPAFLGGSIHLAGLGNLSTSITVTIFYLCFLELWRRRYDRPFTLWYYVLVSAAVVRFIVMLFPQNHWEFHIAPVGYGIFRNIFLTIQGLGVAFLILYDARRTNDRLFLTFSILIFVSFFCMWPVVPFYPRFPLIGMMMIPKTVAYMAIAFIGHKYFFADHQAGGAGST
jgi:hypothetical protein